MSVTTSFALLAAAPAGGGSGITMLPLLLLIPLMYFVMIRPQQKRQKQHRELLSGLKTGDRVVTSSGIHGLIANVKDTTFLLKVADNVKIEIDKSSIAGVERSSDSKPAVSEAKPTA